ncbi:MAG: hemolysin III family protein [Deltaproteobacteria bacterium]|nr:MAG: hemolysin III family protein [Deltaproteobacteria bacterium]
MEDRERERSFYTPREELFNSLTHGAGILLGLAALGVLSGFSSLYGDAWHIVSCSIYAVTLILLYTASTLYHAIPPSRAKEIFQVLDHGAIFLLIAGTYTPFTLVSLRGPWGWSLFGVIWGLAVVGLVCQFLSITRKNALMLGLYIVMGWAVVGAIKPLSASLSGGGMWLLVLGGLAYTFGIIFYVGERIPYHHALWHLCVLLGSTLHFFAVLLYVVLPQ